MSTLTIPGTKGLRAAIGERAAIAGIPGPPQTKQTVIQQTVPWTDWKYISQQTGAQRYLGSVALNGFDRQEGYIFINNTDSNLYIGSYGNPTQIASAPLLTVSPFSSGFLTTELQNLALVADCFGYEFSGKRLNIAAGDTRFGNGVGITIKTANSSDPLPKLRSSWTRIYDAYDITTSVPFTTLTTGLKWLTPSFALEGMTGLTCYGAFTVNAGTGTGVVFTLQDTFPGNALNTYQMLNSGDTQTPIAAGTYITQFSASGVATPTPQIRWEYLTGGTVGTNVVLINILVTIGMAS